MPQSAALWIVASVSTLRYRQARTIAQPASPELLQYPELARYYQTIFDLDWETGLDDFPGPDRAFFAAAAQPAGGLVRLNLGDYVEV